MRRIQRQLATWLVCMAVVAAKVCAQEPPSGALNGSLFPSPAPPIPVEAVVLPQTTDVTVPAEPTPAPKDFAERLADLEADFAKYRSDLAEKEAAEEREQNEPLTKPTFKMNGRIHLDYWAFPEATPGIGFFEHRSPASPDFGHDPLDKVGFRRIRLEMSGDMPRDMFWRMQIDFNEPSEPEMKDVYIGFGKLPLNHTLVVGHQKRPLSLDQLNSSRFNVFVERPFVADAFNEDARRLGALLSTSNEDESLNLAYGVYELENIQTIGETLGDVYQISGNFRVHGSPWYERDGANWFHWGISGMFANTDGNGSASPGVMNEAQFHARPEARSQSRWLDTGRIAGASFYEIFGLEAIYNRGPFQATAEYMTNWVQRDNITPGTGPDLFFHGGYVYAAYFLTGEHMTYKRGDGQINRVHPFHDFYFADYCRGCGGHGWGAWQIALRYSFLDLSNQDITGGFGEAWTFAVNWHWTAYAKLQFDVSAGQIDERGPIGGFTSGNYVITGTRVAVDF